MRTTPDRPTASFHDEDQNHHETLEVILFARRLTDSHDDQAEAYFETQLFLIFES